MTKHVCPTYCHPCPELKGDIMPGCIGGAVYGRLDYCTCLRPSVKKPSETDALIVWHVDALKKIFQGEGYSQVGEDIEKIVSDHFERCKMIKRIANGKNRQ